MKSREKFVLGIVVQVAGILLVLLGTVALPCGLVWFFIPLLMGSPSLFYSEWSPWVAAILLVLPLLLIPIGINCIEAGKRMRRPQRHRRNCPECEYDLRGIRSARCPECGNPLPGR